MMNEKNIKRLGTHILLEFFDCDTKSINDNEGIKRILRDAVIQMGAKVCDETFYEFNPMGLSGAVLISDSHITIHTWPEYSYVAIDIFSCGKSDPWKAYVLLKEFFKPKREVAMELVRGVLA